MKQRIEDQKQKVGWFCTYTPEEVIHAAGFRPYRLIPRYTEGNSTVEDALPGNICPYPRKILSNLRSGLYENMAGIVVANSCNAMIHLYNVLKEEGSFFVYLLDVPRRQDKKAVDYYTLELELLADYLGSQGKPVEGQSLRRSVEIYRQKNKLLEQCCQRYGFTTGKAFAKNLYNLAMEAAEMEPELFINKIKKVVKEEGTGKQGNKPQDNGKVSLLLAGGLPPQGLVEMLSEQQGLQLYPENCAGLRYLQKPKTDLPSGKNNNRKEILKLTARSYLQKPPCPRAFNRQARNNYYRNLLDDLQIRAVIYHDLIFCDMCHYDYLMLKELLEEKNIPHLKVKSELGEEDLGQLKTRVEAFLEILE